MNGLKKLKEFPDLNDIGTEAGEPIRGLLFYLPDHPCEDNRRVVFAGEGYRPRKLDEETECPEFGWEATLAGLCVRAVAFRPATLEEEDANSWAWAIDYTDELHRPTTEELERVNWLDL